MTRDALIEKLFEYGDILVLNEGYVFTLLMTGNELSNWITWSEITNACLEHIGTRFPIVEVMKNDDHFFCLILKPKTDE